MNKLNEKQSALLGKIGFYLICGICFYVIVSGIVGLVYVIYTDQVLLSNRWIVLEICKLLLVGLCMMVGVWAYIWLVISQTFDSIASYRSQGYSYSRAVWVFLCLCALASVIALTVFSIDYFATLGQWAELAVWSLLTVSGVLSGVSKAGRSKIPTAPVTTTVEE